MSDDQSERDAAGTSGSSTPERQARNGQARHIGNSRPWMVVVSQPDFCRVGDKIIGFDSTATLDDPVRYSPNVVSAGERTYRVGDLCCGTGGNAGAGLVSGTSLGSGYVLFQTGQPNLKINGLAPVRDGSQCLVNCNAAGIGGAQGYVYTNTQGVNSLPECAPAEPMDPVQQEIEQINERAREIDERAQEIDATINTSLDQLTPDEAGALRLELEQLKQDSKVLQWRYDEVLDALPENHLAGADVLSLYEAESSINTAIDKIPGPLISDEMLERIKYEAKLTVEMSAEVLFAPYGATKDAQAVWGHLSRGEYLAASTTGLIGLLSVVPGARLLRVGRGAERAAGSAEEVAGSANRTETLRNNDGGVQVSARQGGKVVHRFDNVMDYNRAANNPQPNSLYKYGSYTWETDSLGRVTEASGTVQLGGLNGRAGTDGISTRVIGREGQQGDIGFHLIGDQFGGPTNRLNVVPGNGTRVNANGPPNLNQGQYAKFERSMKRAAQDPVNVGKNVEVRVSPQYRRMNTTSRPDSFEASYRVEGGEWETFIFRNQQGG